jgi:hypothetical protein
LDLGEALTDGGENCMWGFGICSVHQLFLGMRRNIRVMGDVRNSSIVSVKEEREKTTREILTKMGC